MIARFTVPDVHPKCRPRHLKNGHTYKDPKDQAYEDLVKAAYNLKTKRYFFECPVMVTMVFTLKRPKTVKRAYPAVKPDLDNLAKSVLDGLNNTAWKDDGQVVSLKLSKVYGTEASVEVVIEGLENWNIDDIF